MGSNELDAFWAGTAPGERDRYSGIKLIGSGAYSVVARATNVATGEMMAIKRIAEVFYDAQEAKKVLQPIVHAKHKTKIGSFIGSLPPFVGKLDWIDLNPGDDDYFQCGVQKLLKAKEVDMVKNTGMRIAAR